MKHKRWGGNILTYIFLGLFSAVCIFPFIWMLSASFKKETLIFEWPPHLIPKPFTVRNYVDMFRTVPLLRYLFNSTYITVVVVVASALVATMAGYAFSKIRFPGSNLLFLIPLCSMMIPNEVVIVPLFKIWNALGLTNTHVPLIVPNVIGTGGMFGVFLLRQFYLSIPDELAEAACLDGCSPIKTFFRIMFPLAKPALATLAIFSFMNTWNDFFDPFIYLTSTKLYTISLGLNLFTDAQGMQWGQLMAASVIATAPLIIMFFCAQKQFIESVALSGMKT